MDSGEKTGAALFPLAPAQNGWPPAPDFEIATQRIRRTICVDRASALAARRIGEDLEVFFRDGNEIAVLIR